MIIDAHTKIATLLKLHPAALEAIVQLHPKFVKLRNPVLRKLLAGRTTIAMAAKIGGCTVEDFFHQLAPLGFSAASVATEVIEQKQSLPSFMKNLSPETTIELDVRPLLAAGNDPLLLILQKAKALPATHVLKIINTFEPAPLLKLLQEKGFVTFCRTLENDFVETYFYKPINAAAPEGNSNTNHSDWDSIYQQYQSCLQTIEVRDLPMPLPLHTILEAVNQLPADRALFVYHKRVPLFLLPELAQKGFDVRIKEVAEGEVHVLIFKA